MGGGKGVDPYPGKSEATIGFFWYACFAVFPVPREATRPSVQLINE